MRSLSRVGILGILCLAYSTPLLAGIGAGSSGAFPVDTAPPVFLTLEAPEGQTFEAPQQITFVWNVEDMFPGHENTDFTLAVVASGVVLYKTSLPFPTGETVWNWPVPEISSGDCFLRVTARDRYGNVAEAEAGDFRILLPGTSAPPASAAGVLSAVPNPFNPVTTVSFRLPRAGVARLDVYDPAGRRVRRLHDGRLPAGPHAANWDGCDDDSRRLAGGAYVVRLTVDGRPAAVRKVVLLP